MYSIHSVIWEEGVKEMEEDENAESHKP